MVQSNYEVLGISDGSSRDQIRNAFRELALKHHSDRGGHDEYFIKIKQAFEDLKAGKKFPDSPEEREKKSKFFWGTDEEEKKRKNTLLSNDVAKEIHVAEEWLDTLRRTETTGQRLFGSKELGEIEIERKSSKAITIQDLARQANVKISTANAFLKKALVEGTVKKVGGFSGHYIYQPISQ